jgi:hypothetical protein
MGMVGFGTLERRRLGIGSRDRAASRASKQWHVTSPSRIAPRARDHAVGVETALARRNRPSGVVRTSLKESLRSLPGGDADDARRRHSCGMNHVPSSRLQRIALFPLALAFLPVPSRCAPSVEIAGAYFPAWLGVGLVAVACAILARLVMVASGLAEELPLQLFVCISIGLFIGALVWIAWIGP